MTPPRFSIVVPCYRVASYRDLVGDCVASIARQSFTDFELLLVDDCSPDDSRGVLRQVLTRHASLQGRVRLISLSRNTGVCGARNAGIEAASGAYVAFLDFDDFWQPQYLARMHFAASEHPDCPVLLARTDFLCTLGPRMRVRDSGSIDYLNRMGSAEFGAWHLLHNFPVGMGSAAVVARKLYEDHPDLKYDLTLSRTTAEDVLFGFQLLARGIRPWYVDEPLCVARRKLERESRGMTALNRLDERQVNDYLLQKASLPLMLKVISERPDLEAPVRALWKRLDLRFDLKRDFRRPDRWFGIGRCLREPRGFKVLARLLATKMLLDGPLEAVLHWYFFISHPNHAVALERVTSLMLRLQSIDEASQAGAFVTAA